MTRDAAMPMLIARWVRPRYLPEICWFWSRTAKVSWH